MAQAFSSALDSAFMLDSDVDNLSQTIDQKWVTFNNSLNIDIARDSRGYHDLRIHSANLNPKGSSRCWSRTANWKSCRSASSRPRDASSPSLPGVATPRPNSAGDKASQLVSAQSDLFLRADWYSWPGLRCSGIWLCNSFPGRILQRAAAGAVWAAGEQLNSKHLQMLRSGRSKKGPSNPGVGTSELD